MIFEPLRLRFNCIVLECAMHFASETRKYAKLAGGEPVSIPAKNELFTQRH